FGLYPNNNLFMKLSLLEYDMNSNPWFAYIAELISIIVFFFFRETLTDGSNS
ncbi:hypothetical protein ACJX0J_017536, partial [Zea mays]